jgi:hypothetical protein
MNWVLEWTSWYVVRYSLHVSFTILYTHIIISNLFLFSVRDKKQELIGVGTICDYMHTLTNFGRVMTEDIRVRTNHS